MSNYNRTLLWSGDKASSVTLSEPSTNFERIAIWLCSHDGPQYGNIVIETKPFSTTTPKPLLFIPGYWSTIMRIPSARRISWTNASTFSIISDNYFNLPIANSNINGPYSDGSASWKCIRAVWGINRK